MKIIIIILSVITTVYSYGNIVKATIYSPYYNCYLNLVETNINKIINEKCKEHDFYSFDQLNPNIHYNGSVYFCTNTKQNIELYKKNDTTYEIMYKGARLVLYSTNNIYIQKYDNIFYLIDVPKSNNPQYCINIYGNVTIVTNKTCYIRPKDLSNICYYNYVICTLNGCYYNDLSNIEKIYYVNTIYYENYQEYDEIKWEILIN